MLQNLLKLQNILKFHKFLTQFSPQCIIITHTQSTLTKFYSLSNYF
jgi:hypothetical protein